MTGHRRILFVSDKNVSTRSEDEINVAEKCMRSSQVVRASDCRRSRNGPGFNSTSHEADPDPGSGAFLTPGSGIRVGKKSGSGSGIRNRDEEPGSYFRELRNNFLGLKYLNSLMRIRDENNLDPQHWISASPDAVKSEGRRMKKCWIKYLKNNISKKPCYRS